MEETWVLSLGWKDPLQKGMATCSSILAQKIQRREEPGRLQSMGSQRAGCDWATKLNWMLLCVCVSCSVVSYSLWSHSLQLVRLLCPWNSLGENTGAGSHSLLQGIFPTQGSNQVSHIAGRHMHIYLCVCIYIYIHICICIYEPCS